MDVISILLQVLIITIIITYLTMASIQLLGIDNDDNDMNAAEEQPVKAQKYNFDKHKKRDRLSTCRCMLRHLDFLLIWERMERQCFTIRVSDRATDAIISATTYRAAWNGKEIQCSEKILKDSTCSKISQNEKIPQVLLVPLKKLITCVVHHYWMAEDTIQRKSEVK